jgi:hypothetical protein
MANNEENPYHYSGMHAFGFLQGVSTSPDEVIGAIRELGEPPGGPVIFAGAFVGDYEGFVHVRAEDLGSLQRAISDQLHGAGFRGFWAIEQRVAEKQVQTDEGTVMLKVGVKRGTEEVIAISALRVKPGKLDDVLEAVKSISTFRGASVVFGQADILLQLGDADFDVVATSVADEVQAVQGLASASTAFCDGTR